jgi:hypothetical protein
MTAGTVYHFQLTGIEDCWGNSATSIEGQFAFPEAFQAGDLIINEILFNASEGGRDFVEIYNKSLHNISLKGWTIADNYSGAMNTPDTICTRDFILFPGEYLILTRNDGSLKQLYPNTHSDRIWDVPGLSDFGSTEDVVYLIAPGSVMSDELNYTVDMQFPLIDNPDGVSLERINYERSTSDKTNWHSASESVGFATPGYLNSQAFAGGLTEEEFSGEPEVFSPDNDGYQDVITFSYKMDAPGYVGNIKVFDSEGRQIRHLMKNELLGNNGSVSWDGFSDDRQLAHVGIYVIYFEVFATNGTTKGIKIPAVVAQKLK